MRQGTLHAVRRRELLILASGLLGAVAMGLTGWSVALRVVLLMSLPVAGFLLAGHLSGRTAVVGCVILALGSTLIHPAPGSMPWRELAVLGGLAASVVLAGGMADRLAAQPMGPESAGRWMTIVVECEGPTGTSGVLARPKVSPCRDPERRSLAGPHGARRRGRRSLVKA
jgi:hypothetical protein